jgi:release factor glutamine methyltransferase
MNNQTKFYFKEKLYECPKNVYLPAEDSYLLAQATQPNKKDFAIDIGCGTGIQTINILSKGASHVIATDIKSECLKTTKTNCKIAGFSEKVETRKSDLFNKVPEKFDLITFNPPYVETEEIKYTDLDGGKKGREILDRFLEEFPNHLNKGGTCYFLQTNINGYKETEKKLKKHNLKFKIIARKKMFFEELAVFKATNKK